MGTVGYYLALISPEPELEYEGAYEIERAAPVDGDAIEQTENVELRYAAGRSRQMQLAIEQTHGTGDAEMVTEIDLDMTETRRDLEQGGVEYDRAYERVGLSITEQGEPVDAQIAAQIESLLVGTRAVTSVSAIGKPTSHEWRSVTNPEVRHTLNIVRHSTRLLMPHLRRDAVNPGDRWTYRLPAESVADNRFVQSLDGEVVVDTEYLGTTERGGRRLAILDRSIEVSGGGEINLEDEPGTRWFELTSQGSGRVRFDIEDGSVVDSRLSVDRSLELQGGDEQSATREGHIELYVREAPKSDAAPSGSTE